MKLFFATFFVSMLAGVALFANHSNLEITGFDFLKRLGFSKQPMDIEPTVLTSLQLRPAVTIALAIGEEQSADIAAVVELLQPGFGDGLVQACVNGMFAGTDPQRRAGAIVYYEGSRVTPFQLAFIPIIDRERFETVLSEFGQIMDGNPSQFCLDNGQSYYFWHRGEYAFFGSHRESFDHIHVDPNDWIELLPERHNLAVRIDAESIPQSIRDHAYLDWQKSIRESARQSVGESANPNLNSIDEMLSAYMTMIRQIEEVTLGIELDPEQNRIVLESEIIAGASSLMSRYGSKAKQMKSSQYAGFRLDDALLNLNWCSPILRDQAYDLTLLAEVLEATAGFPDERMDQLANEAGRAIKRTVSKGRADGSLVGTFDESGFNFAAVIHIPDTSRIANILDDLIRPKGLGLSEFGRPSQKTVVNHLAGSHRGINFYQHMETMDKDSLASQRVAYVIGAARNELFLGVGSNPTPLLERCIDACLQNPVKANSDLSFSCNLQEWAKIGKHDAGIRQAMASLNGDERLSMTSKMTDRGSIVRFELDFDILKVLSEIGQAKFGAFDLMNDLN